MRFLITLFLIVALWSMSALAQTEQENTQGTNF